MSRFHTGQLHVETLEAIRELAMIDELSDEEWEAWLTVTDKFHAFLSREYGDDD